MGNLLASRGRDNRHGASHPKIEPAFEVRESLIALARENGWHVVGHRWLRMTRDGSTVEAWFTDVTARLVKARYVGPAGEVCDLDIIHNRGDSRSLVDVVVGWLGAGTRLPAAAPNVCGARVGSLTKGFDTTPR